MRKEFVELPDYEDDDSVIQEDDIDLLDEPEDIEDDEDDIEISEEEIAKHNFKLYLDNQLSIKEQSRAVINATVNGEKMTLKVLAKSKKFDNRYIFELKDKSLKAYNIEEIKL